MTQPHPDDGLEPAYAAPRNACDAHFHVFGPADKYPHVTTDLRYQPPSAPLAEYLAVASRLGHSSAALTLSTYAHVLPGADHDAAQRIDNLLSGSKRVANEP